MPSKKVKNAQKKTAAVTSAKLGDYLRALRLEKKLTLRKVAEQAGAQGAGAKGLSHAYLSQVETGKIKRPRHDALSALATAYGADYWELLRRAGYQGPGPDAEGAGRLAAAPGASLDWLPPAVTGLNRGEQRDVSRYIEYLLWSRNEPKDSAPSGVAWIGWQEVQDWTREMRTELRSEFDPDMVIGLGRGGAILGGMVAGALGLKPVSVLDMAHKPHAKEESRFIDGSLDLKGVGKALLVQGEVRTGRSLVEARKVVTQQAKKRPAQPFELKTLALIVYPDVPPKLWPDWHMSASEFDPPWRRVTGYQAAMRLQFESGENASDDGA